MQETRGPSGADLAVLGLDYQPPSCGLPDPGRDRPPGLTTWVDVPSGST